MPTTLDDQRDLERDLERETALNIRQEVEARWHGVDKRLTHLSGFEDKETKQLVEAFNELRKAKLPTMAPLLPLLLQLKGRPFSLKDYFPFQPAYRTHLPREILFITGRQVSKSTTLAGQGIASSAAIPYLTTLYVTPLFEQVRRFSQNYVRPLIDDSPVKRLLQASGSTANVLQRSFLNGAMMQFSYAFLDAERTRGISAGRRVVDESVHWCTPVETPKGIKPIIDIRPGELVASFTNDGKKVWKKVLNFWYHGRRRCYSLTTNTGRHVAVTADTKMATNAGWLRVSEIVQAVRDRVEKTVAKNPGSATRIDANSKCAFGRHAPGRRAPEQIGQLRGRSRSAAKRVPLDETYLDVRVRGWDAFHIEEEQTRIQVSQVLDCQYAGIEILADALLPGWRQDNHPCAAQVARHSGLSADDGLVDRGRRHALRTPTLADPDDLYARFFLPRGRELVSMAGGARLPVLAAAHSQRRPGLLGADIFGEVRGETDERGEALYASLHALQANRARTQGRSHLLVLRDEVSHALRAGDYPRPELDLLLRLARLQDEEESHLLRQDNGRQPSAGGNVCPPAPALRIEQGSSGLPQVVLRRAQKASPGLVSWIQTQAQSKRKGKTASSHLYLPHVRQIDEERGRSAFQSRRMPPLPSGVPEDLCAGQVSSKARKLSRSAKTPGFAYETLLSIEDVGVHDVFDIEVEDTHTVYFNGFAATQCQDLNYDFLPVIDECLSASPWGIKQASGTPKSLDNTIERLWQDSSQAEWVIRCQHGSCNHWNVPALTHDLWDMIGKWRSDISEKEPAIVCAMCRKPLRPRTGRWIHAYPERRFKFAGYHIPQIIMPMHYGDPEKWSLLLDKMAGRGNMTRPQFLNEVCGVSSDEGAKLVTVTDLRNAACLPWKNDWRIAERQIKRYRQRVLAVDWGGGGGRLRSSGGKKEDKRLRSSFTTLAVLGFHPSGKVDVLWGYRSLRTHDYEWEARLCIEALAKFRCSHFVHDYSNAGAAREVFIAQAGWPYANMIAMRYHGAASGNIINFHPATDDHPRDWWSLDRSYSLLLTCQSIKSGLIRFFEDDYKTADSPGLLRDFLALVEEKVDGRVASDAFYVARNPNMPDDFAHTVNMGAVSLWHMQRAWPNLAMAARMKIKPSVLNLLHPRDPVRWDEI